MKRAIITHQGFTETNGQTTGTGYLYRDVVRTFSGPDCMTHPPVEWSHSPKKLVGLLLGLGVKEVISIGYSWGGGFGAQRFSKLAIKSGIRVRLQLLCDPVFRPRWLPTWLPANILSVRSLFRRSACITVPRGVEKVAVAAQTRSIPAGHPLKLHIGTKHLGKLTLNHYCHTTIDSADEWYGMVRNELRKELDKAP